MLGKAALLMKSKPYGAGLARSWKELLLLLSSYADKRLLNAD